MGKVGRGEARLTSGDRKSRREEKSREGESGGDIRQLYFQREHRDIENVHRRCS